MKPDLNQQILTLIFMMFIDSYWWFLIKLSLNSSILPAIPREEPQQVATRDLALLLGPAMRDGPKSSLQVTFWHYQKDWQDAYLYIYTYAYTYVQLYIYIHIHIKIYLHKYIYTHTFTYIYIYKDIYLYIHIYIYMDMYIYIYVYICIRIYAYGDFHYTCAFDVMSLSPGSMWWCYHLRRWYHLWLRRYEEGRAVDLGRRTAMESWVSKRVLRDLVAQGIHYLLSHVAGPFHSGFICNWQGQLFWFWWIPPLPAVSFTLVAEPRAPATSV